MAFASDPSGFSFFQLVLLMDRFFAGRPPAGSVSGAAQETTRFRALASLGFPAADIADLSWHLAKDEDGTARPRLDATVAFLGLYGPSSPLAPHYTEALLGGDQEQDTLRGFLDLFNHRLVALAFRTWKKYRYYAVFRDGAVDELSRSVFALLGHSPADGAGLEGQDQGHRASDGAGIEWPRLLRFAGVLGLNCRSPAVLAQVVAAYFGVPARVEEAVERVVEIPDAQRHRLGGQRSTLESDWVLGGTLPDVAGMFRLWLGPLTGAEFAGFLPGGASHEPLHALMRYLVRDALAYDIWLLPQPGAVHGLSLGGDAPLGWAAWLGGDDDMLGKDGAMLPSRHG